ncbi:MAG: hypothetical protein QXR45_09970 [Candidatus Bathyarchaeia archaeon]
MWKVKIFVRLVLGAASLMGENSLTGAAISMSKLLTILLFSILLLSSVRPCLCTDQDKLAFYIISCESCEEYRERELKLRISLRRYFPDAEYILWDIDNQVNINRFRIIMNITGEILFMPLMGVFKDDKLIAIFSGPSLIDDWSEITMERREGVPIYYVDDKHLKIKAFINDLGKIAALERAFREPYVSGAFPQIELMWLLGVVIVGAAIDAVNPCFFTAFIVLLTLIYYRLGKRHVLKNGLSFIGAVYIAYFLVGLSGYGIMFYIPQRKYIFALLALAIGGLQIYGSFRGKVELIPQTLASKISTLLRLVSNPKISFIAGFISGFLLLPCSSAPYFVVLSLISERVTLLTGILLLTLYNLIIISPLLVITLCIYVLLTTTRNLKRLTTRKKRLISLLSGLGLLGIAFIAFFT